ncbi:MAG: gfo/Idh/MocA family oxidoreductase, partial [Firmicutes bacterium]|nr:gfo/Idh/MocA family oxidoreductase [Bacillota bacterium]
APAIQKARNLLKASKGIILDIRAEESHSGSHAGYARLWKLSGGGSLLRLGAHPVGAVIHLKHYEGMIRNGRPIRVKSVMAETANLTSIPAFKVERPKWLVSDWQDVEDWAAVVVTLEDGTKATIFANDITLGGVGNNVTIYLANGIIRCNITPNNTCETYAPSPEVFGDEYIAEKLETKAGWNFASPDEDWMRGYPQEIQDFLEAIYYNRNPLSDGELGKEVVRVVYASYVSAETGRRVDLEKLAEGDF